MRSRLCAGITFAVATVVLVSPQLASACAVCAAGRDEGARQAFLWTTGMLSALPPLIVGGLVWWLVKRARRARAWATPEKSQSAGLAPDEWVSLSGSSVSR